MKRKKEFEETEYNPRKCQKCGSQDFVFIVMDQSKTESSSEDNYKCKICGNVQS